MKFHRALSALVLVLWGAASGCTTLREVPRASFGDLPERKGVRVETRDGLVYDFDYATFDGGDSLTGYRHRSDVEGPVDQTAVLRIALDDVDHLTARRFDWYRTGLTSGAVLAAVLVAGLGLKKTSSSETPPTSGGGDPRLP